MPNCLINSSISLMHLLFFSVLTIIILHLALIPSLKILFTFDIFSALTPRFKRPLLSFLNVSKAQSLSSLKFIGFSFYFFIKILRQIYSFRNCRVLKEFKKRQRCFILQDLVLQFQ